jgi:hypothetical protein
MGGMTTGLCGEDEGKDMEMVFVFIFGFILGAFVIVYLVAEMMKTQDCIKGKWVERK